MAEINYSNEDLINKALEYQDDLMSDLFHNIISRSAQAEAYSELHRRSNEETFIGDREAARLEKIQLANTIIAHYITREF